MNEKIASLEEDLKSERRRCGKFEDQVDQLRDHLDKLTSSALADKQSEISAAQNEKEYALKIQRLENDREELQEKHHRMKDQMQHIYHTLGKVTGEEDEERDGDSTSKMTQSS